VPPAGCDLVLKTDGLIGGVHFFPDDPADAVAKKALRVNLSDLAAKGARPLGFLLALALPQEIGRRGLSRSRVALAKMQSFLNSLCSAATLTERPAQSRSQLQPSAQFSMER
jgi:thiamine monophosphate kinase